MFRRFGSLALLGFAIAVVSRVVKGAAEEKAEEQRIIDRAKFYLIEKKQMTEDEAHRYIGKQSMDSGISRRRIAERILDD